MSPAPAFRDADFSSPAFDPYRPALARLARDAWPGCERLNALAAELGTQPRSALGLPVRFAAPDPSVPGYEMRVHETGCVSTRTENWHDLLNALAWLAFPRTKSALNALHAAAIPREGGRRGRLRDLLTLLDEGGALVACADPELEDMIRGFRWSELFWHNRARVERELRIAVLGHAVLEKALAPWPGVTCKALFFPFEPEALRAPAPELARALDARAAQWIESNAARAVPRDLAPLPVFGYPGWFPGNDRAEFYLDTRYFRPFRRDLPAPRRAARG